MRIQPQLASALLILAIGIGRAEEPASLPAAERPALDFTHCWGGCKASCRADCPQAVACYARPGESSAFIGYYVGGGSVCRGECRDSVEGTWGWDYQGHCLPRRVALLWTHGRRYQGCTGDYRTDGGPPVPDLPGSLNPALHRQGHE